MAEALAADIPAPFSFSTFVSYGGAILRSRIDYLLNSRERRHVRAAIRRAFGETVSRAEVGRLAVSSYAYRAMSRRDEEYKPTVVFHDPQGLAGREALYLGPASLVPQGLASCREFERGELKFLPAPFASPGGAKVLAEAVAAGKGRPIVFTRYIRTGTQSIRVEFSRAPESMEALIRLFNDSIRENPAFYDWFSDHDSY